MLFVFLNSAHVPGGFILHAAAVLFAELYPAVCAEADDGDEANRPGDSDNDTGLGDSRVKGLTRDDEWCRALHGGGGGRQGCGIGRICGD